MHPALNLSLGFAALLLVFLMLRPKTGWLWQWQRRAQPERVRIEDALKYLYGCHEAQTPCSVDSLAGALEITRNEAVQLVGRLEQQSLVSAQPPELHLTEDGRKYALQVIRTHRLWEQYLAENTGLDEREWHERADRVEHELSPQQVDALAARMGDPVFDPHGDPIPSATGMVRRPDSQPLNVVPAGVMYRIVHVEDEPESTYRVLREAQLQSGMLITVVSSSSYGIELDTGASTCRLSPLVAANVAVQPLGERDAKRVSLRRLASLPMGEQAVVSDISPACRGVERRRLLDLGLVSGTVVKAEFASPAGDPVAYRVRGALIALRAQQAELIYIQ
jgi:DtxR family Mn-dependent transcriptional regulator